MQCYIGYFSKWFCAQIWNNFSRTNGHTKTQKYASEVYNAYSNLQNIASLQTKGFYQFTFPLVLRYYLPPMITNCLKFCTYIREWHFTVNLCDPESLRGEDAFLSLLFVSSFLNGIFIKLCPFCWLAFCTLIYTNSL